MRRPIAAILILILLFSVSALAESFAPDRVAATGYSRSQWLSNDNSRALLVCLIARDYCDARSASFKSVASALLSRRSYIANGDSLKVYIPCGDDYLCVKISFDGAASSASAKKCSASEARSADYTVMPDDCETILAD